LFFKLERDLTQKNVKLFLVFNIVVLTQLIGFIATWLTVQATNPDKPYLESACSKDLREYNLDADGTICSYVVPLSGIGLPFQFVSYLFLSAEPQTPWFHCGHSVHATRHLVKVFCWPYGSTNDHPIVFLSLIVAATASLFVQVYLATKENPKT